jgi:hypothetical protein
MWAAMNGHAEAVKALIMKGADKDATEKVRRRYCVLERVERCFGACGANDQGMFGTGLRDLGATGRMCPIHCSCGLCHEVN